MIRSLAVLLALSSQTPQTDRVSATLTPTGYFLKPIGKNISVPGQVVDMTLHPSGKWAYLKSNRGLSVVNTSTMRTVQEISIPEDASRVGILIDKLGQRLWISTAQSTVWQGRIGKGGLVQADGILRLPKPPQGGSAHPTSMTLSADGNQLYVCAFRSNTVEVFDLGTQAHIRSLATDIAPFAIKFGNNRLYVACWGGKRPGSGARTAFSGQTPIEVDERGIAKAPTVAVYPNSLDSYTSIRTGLQPSDIEVTPDGRALIANANQDTVTEISKDLRHSRDIVVKPEFNLPLGTAPTRMTLNGHNLFVACGGNNAIAVISTKGVSKLLGFLPSGWYPTAVAARGGSLYAVTSKGGFTGGSFQKIDLSELKRIKIHTSTVQNLVDVEAITNANEQEEEESVEEHDEPLVPLPDRLGEETSIEHVVYIITSGRTYDEMFGDVKKGTGNRKLVKFGRDVTPNQHALAEQFVLLDNFYSNGSTRAEGLAWATEGNASSFFERSTQNPGTTFDPLSPSGSGFIWDHALLYGKGFRNYGLMAASSTFAPSTWSDNYQTWRSGKQLLNLTHSIGVDRLKSHTRPNYPGWNPNIPDGYRAEVFIKDIQQFNRASYFPKLTTVYLPQDRVGSQSAGQPSVRSMVADNDLAIGRCIEALSTSRYWKRMAIFVIGENPGGSRNTRATCLVVSPFTQTGKVVKTFYSQPNILASINRMLSMPPLNQMDSRAQLMVDCFVDKGNFKAFKAHQNRVPLNEFKPD